MADPRKIVKYDEIGILRQTFATDGVTILFDSTKPGNSVSVGLAVSLSANDTVQLAGDGEAIIGLLDLVERDGMCTVSVKGFLPFKAAATTPALVRGAGIVGGLGAAAAKGYVKGSATGRGVLVNDTVTAVYVLF